MIPVGRITSTHGIRGEVRFKYYNWSTEDLYRYTSFITEADGKSISLCPENIRTGKNIFIIKFRGFNNPEEVFFLLNKELYVKEEDLPVLGDDEFYVYQLIGMNVSDSNGVRLGPVKEVLNTGSCDIIVVEGDGELLIPMTEECVLKIDIANRRIDVAPDAVADVR